MWNSTDNSLSFRPGQFVIDEGLHFLLLCFQAPAMRPFMGFTQRFRAAGASPRCARSNPYMATSLNNLALLYKTQGQIREGRAPLGDSGNDT